MLFPIRILTDLVRTLGGMGVTFHPRHQVIAVDAERGAITANGKDVRGRPRGAPAGAWLTKLFPELRRHHGPVAAGGRLPVAAARPARRLGPRTRLHRHRPRQRHLHPPAARPARASRSATTSSPAPATRRQPRGHRRRRRAADAGRPLAYRDFDRYYTILERKACFYTVTEDESFHVKPLGARPPCNPPARPRLQARPSHRRRRRPRDPRAAPHGDLAAWAAGR